jgi:hypothetical protein
VPPGKNLALIDSIIRKEMLSPPKRRKLPTGREKNPICDFGKTPKIVLSSRSTDKSGNAFFPLATQWPTDMTTLPSLKKLPAMGIVKNCHDR